MKMINLGAGSNILPPPWENYDADLDITKPLPFADGSVDRILIEHCLEHVSMQDALRFLIGAHRVLKVGGVIRICVPIIENLETDHAMAIILQHGHQGVYDENILWHMLRVAGFAPRGGVDAAVRTDRKEEDGHWRVIGRELDDLETLRMEATK